MNIIFEILYYIGSGMYIGFIGFLNAFGIKDAVETAYHQIIAIGLGIPVIVVSAVAAIAPIARIIIKRAF